MKLSDINHRKWIENSFVCVLATHENAKMRKHFWVPRRFVTCSYCGETITEGLGYGYGFVGKKGTLLVYSTNIRWSSRPDEEIWFPICKSCSVNPFKRTPLRLNLESAHLMQDFVRSVMTANHKYAGRRSFSFVCTPYIYESLDDALSKYSKRSVLWYGGTCYKI